MSHCTAFSPPASPCRFRASFPSALQQQWGFPARRSRIRMLSRGSPPRNRNSCPSGGAVDCPRVCVSEQRDWRISQAETSTLTERTGHYPQCASRVRIFAADDVKVFSIGIQNATFVILRVASPQPLEFQLICAARAKNRFLNH